MLPSVSEPLLISCHLDLRLCHLDLPGRAKAVITPPLSFRFFSLSFRALARNLVVPGRAKVVITSPLSFRSEARNLFFPAEDYSQACLRSLPCGRDDSGGRGRSLATKDEISRYRSK